MSSDVLGPLLDEFASFGNVLALLVSKFGYVRHKRQSAPVQGVPVGSTDPAPEDDFSEDISVLSATSVFDLEITPLPASLVANYSFQSWF